MCKLSLFNFIHFREPYTRFANKDAIAQDFTLHDALLRGKCALEQLAKGLDDVGLLKLMRQFPLEFEPLFTDGSSEEELTGAVVFKMFRFPDDLIESQQRVAGWLRQFVTTCNVDGEWFC